MATGRTQTVLANLVALVAAVMLVHCTSDRISTSVMSSPAVQAALAAAMVQALAVQVASRVALIAFHQVHIQLRSVVQAQVVHQVVAAVLAVIRLTTVTLARAEVVALQALRRSASRMSSSQEAAPVVA